MVDNVSARWTYKKHAVSATSAQLHLVETDGGDVLHEAGGWLGIICQPEGSYGR